MPVRIKLRIDAFSSGVFFLLTILEEDVREVCSMVYEFSHSAKLGIHIPPLDWWLMHNILHITRSGLSRGLIFNVKVVSIML